MNVGLSNNFNAMHFNFLYASDQAGKADFETLEKKAMEWDEPSVPSGKQVSISNPNLFSMPV